MAGPVYNFDPDLESDVKFPEYFDNHFFAGEWTRGWIRDIAMDAEGDVAGIDPFFDSMTLYAAMDMEFGPDGSLYVLDYGNGGYFTGNENSAVYKINAINEGARSPSASATATPDSGVAPLHGDSSPARARATPTRATRSSATPGTSRTTARSTRPSPTRRSSTRPTGVYDARLTVTDSTGRTGVATAVVTVGNTRPVVEIELPPNGGFFEFGDSVRVKVNVTDPEDGEIDCSKVEDRLHPRPRLARPPAQLRAPAATSSCRPCRTRATTPRPNIFGVINASYTDEGAGRRPRR